MRIVLDISTSWIWHRPPVGIVRTERKFAQHLLQRQSADIAFCRYDKVRRVHVQVERAVAEALFASEAGLSPKAVDDDTPSESPVTTSPPPRLRDRARRVLHRVERVFIGRLPQVLQAKAWETLVHGKSFVKGGLAVTGGAARLVRARWRARHAGAPATGPQPAAEASADAFAFASSDVYVSMGLDWEYNDLPQLVREKRRVGFRTVLFCYDTIPVQFPHLMSFDSRQYFARYFVDLAHAADRVAAISEASRRDFQRLLTEVGAPIPSVDVVHLGTDIDTPSAAGEAPVGALEGAPFVLYVSTIEARKNHEVLYNVWDRLVAAHGDAAPKLVLVGMVGWGVTDLLFRVRTNPRLAGQVVILDNLADAELFWLYRHCLFSVFPSLYEGWGLPVVECLALGKPCICSNAPAVSEAAQGQGDGARSA